MLQKKEATISSTLLWGSEVVWHVIHFMPKPAKRGLGARVSLSHPQAPFWQLWVGDGWHFRLWEDGCNGNCKSVKVNTIFKRTQISQQLSVWTQFQSWNLMIVHYSCRIQQANIKHFILQSKHFCGVSKLRKEEKWGGTPPTSTPKK